MNKLVLIESLVDLDLVVSSYYNRRNMMNDHLCQVLEAQIPPIIYKFCNECKLYPVHRPLFSIFQALFTCSMLACLYSASLSLGFLSSSNLRLR